MKGLIALAKKNESISDKIVRLYKEGYSIPEIAKEMEMPKDNVPRILEKHFPDYASFEQPVREGADENGNGKKSVFNMSVSELFGKKNKKQESVEPARAEPASAPVPPEDNSVHLVTPEALKEAEEKAKAEENAKAEATVAEEVPTMDEVEMPSIEPISLDDTMVVSPAPESTMPSIEDEIAEKKAAEAENTNNNEEGENMGMSPMEKMRMFAQEQIEMNNKKIDELKASIAETEAKSLDLGKQASDIYEEIVKLQEKAKALNAEKEQVDIQISQVNAEIEGIRKENNEFKSYM